MPSWTRIVTNNLKMAAVGTVAVLVTGTGAATSISLVSDSSEAPEQVVATSSAEAPAAGTVSDTPTAGIELPKADDDADDADEAGDAAEAPKSDTATVGIRPTDTHGYCVSTAVHAAKAAGTSRSEAAHSCAKKDKPAKAAKAAKPAKTKAVKAAKPAKHAKARPAKAAKPAKAKAAKASKGKGSGKKK
jgi:hypothetical protein